jgi:hypothetical protein
MELPIGFKECTIFIKTSLKLTALRAPLLTSQSIYNAKLLNHLGVVMTEFNLLKPSGNFTYHQV